MIEFTSITQNFHVAVGDLDGDGDADVAGLQLLAEKDGSDYVLSGTKCWISNGGEADLYTVFATLDRASRHQGICAFIVPADLPGIRNNFV